MVHAYKSPVGYIAVDVDSGAVHILDEAAYLAVNAWQEGGEDGAYAAVADALGAEAAWSAISEIRELIDNGLLFTDIPVEEQDIKPPEGIVKALCLHIAHDCDLRCRYCFAGAGSFHGSREMMPAQLGKEALDFLVKSSGERRNLEVDFFGGEPLLNLDAVREIVAYGRQLERKHRKIFHFTLTTNATALDDAAIAFINQEMDNCVLSLDGRQEVHDYMRPRANGEGSFQDALDNAKRLISQRAGKDYFVRGTFTRRNLDFAEDALLLADAGFEQLSLEPVVLDSSSPYSILEEHLPTVLREYDKLLNGYLKRRKQGRWFSFFHFVVDLSGGPCLRKRLTGCGAGYEYLAVTPKGDLYPCHQFVGREEFRLGSLREGLVRSDLAKAFSSNHVMNKPICRDCWAKYYCGGGCAANAQAFGGGLDTPYAIECVMERKRLECAIAVQAAEYLQSMEEDAV